MWQVMDLETQGCKREGAVVHECLKAIHRCGRNPGVMFPVAVFDVGDDNVPSIGVNCDPLTPCKQGKSGAEFFFAGVYYIGHVFFGTCMVGGVFFCQVCSSLAWRAWSTRPLSCRDFHNQ
jgi:hypothetical protein